MFVYVRCRMQFCREFFFHRKREGEKERKRERERERERERGGGGVEEKIQKRNTDIETDIRIREGPFYTHGEQRKCAVPITNNRQ